MPPDPALRRQFAANMRRRRERLGLTQEALGYRAGLHMTEISKLERAVQEPRLTTIVLVARALEVRPGHLLRGIK